MICEKGGFFMETHEYIILFMAIVIIFQHYSKNWLKEDLKRLNINNDSLQRQIATLQNQNQQLQENLDTLQNSFEKN